MIDQPVADFREFPDRHLLEAIAPLGDAVSTSFIILPLAHVRLGHAAIQLLVLDDEARV